MNLLRELLTINDAEKIASNLWAAAKAMNEADDFFAEPESEDAQTDSKKADDSKKSTDKEETPPEEPKEEIPKTIEQLFTANSGEVKEYSHIDLYDAKKLEVNTVITANGKRTSAKAGNYVVRNHDDIKKFVIVDGEDFDGQYEPVRQGEKPDAEGFILVKPVGEIEAFQYKGESITVKNGWNEEVDIQSSEFVVRYTDEQDSGWTVPKVEFNKTYKLK